ncbi:hypothetical protein [Rhodopirellula halodulae]|uniref:hypothetical protein n=1 Tax=Rhodopirellula halodulae TaxID=2894198 RepID=UPI001E2DED37|nr:hypothetical protein [Rhodopirellula sp. JC737]MCC9656996.1 hypothetical protein [Rhodopirellula sp. JC737]
MEILLVLVAAWLAVTLLGHLSWVILRTIFQLIFRPSELLESRPSQTRKSGNGNNSPSRKLSDDSSPPDPKQDLIAFSRMLDALIATGRLPRDEARSLRDSAKSLADGEPHASPTPPPIGPTLDEKPSIVQPPAFESPSSKLPVAAPKAEAGSAETEPSVVTAALVSPSPEPSPSTLRNQTPTTPKKALSEVITSFLARNNIRWGELVAGLLVVVCSIGLVVSLWNTLTSAHRVIPSLIFMGADAAIFAAGLYTVKRWKLRHTSRAVLIIATLLVPLCVLAGMAAAGAGLDSVSLSDPATLGTIAVGLAGCGWLLLQSSRSLVGRADALALTTSVIAPTLSLPLLPTAARWLGTQGLGTQAGYAVIVPAIIVAATLLWPRHRDRTRLLNADSRSPMGGRRHWKNRWLSIGIATAAMSSVLVYAAFLLSGFDSPQLVQMAWIQIAIASIPFWVAVASSCHQDASRLRQAPDASPSWVANSHLIATVLKLLSLGIVLAVLPASLRQLDWMWVHASVAAASWGVASLALRQRGVIAGTSLPLGAAAMISSPTWLGDTQWGELPLWRMILGGEAMAVSLGMSLLLGSVAFVLCRTKRDSKLIQNEIGGTSLAAAAWGALAFVQALVLSLAPESWRGVIPSLTVEVVLGLSTLACIAASMKEARSARATPWICLAFWASAIGLVNWIDGRASLDLNAAPWIGLAVAMSLAAAAVLNRFLPTLVNQTTNDPEPSSNREMSCIPASLSSMKRHAIATGASSCLAMAALGGVALLSNHAESVAAPGWWLASGQLWLLTLLLGLTSVLLKKRGWLQTTMCLSLVPVVTCLTAGLGVTTWHADSWWNGIATWWVAVIFTATAALWLLARESQLLRQWFSDEQPTHRQLNWQAMPDGWMGMLAVGTIVFTVARQYAAIAVAPLQTMQWWPNNQWFTAADFAWYESAGALALISLTLGLFVRSRQHSENASRSGSEWKQWATGLLAAACIYLACQFAIAWTTQAATCLVLATSLSCAFLLAWKYLPRWLLTASHKLSALLENHDTNRSQPWIPAIATFLVALGSLVLLGTDWLTSLSNNQSPNVVSTLAVSIWWVMSSIALLWSQSTTRREEVSNSLLSAVLLPLAVGIACPAVIARVPFAKEPLVWLQVSVLGSLVWWSLQLVRQRLSTQANHESVSSQGTLSAGTHLTRAWILSMGLIGCVGSIWVAGWSTGTMLQPPFSLWTLPVGALISLVGVAVVMRHDLRPAKDAWPFAISLLSGHAAVLAVWLKWIAPESSLLLMSSLWLLAAAGSAVVHWRRNIPLHAWHLTALTFVLAWVAVFADTPTTWGLSVLALASLSVAGVSSARFGRALTSPEPADSTEKQRPRWQTLGSLASDTAWDWRSVLPRLIGWSTVGIGCWLLWFEILDPYVSFRNFDPTSIWLAWMAIWVLIWRWTGSQSSASLADSEVALAMIPVAGLGWMESHLALPRSVFAGAGWQGPTSGLMTIGSLALVAASAWLRPQKRTVWFASVVLSCIALSETALWVLAQSSIDTNSGFIATHLAVTVGLIAWTFATSVVGGSRFRLATALESVGLLWAGVSSLLACYLVLDHVAAPWPAVCILATGTLAWVFYELAERNLAQNPNNTSPNNTAPNATSRRRHIAVGLVLWSIGLLAVLTGLPQKYAVLIAVMRLLVASVVMVAVFLLGIPKLLSGPFLERWNQALTRGGLLSGLVATIATVLMLALEVSIRQPIIGIPEISMPVVVAVAITLGALGVIAGVWAVLAGPATRQSPNTRRGPNTRPSITLTDNQRKGLLYFAQGIAATTWLHLFLCRTGIAFLGLRQVWPYVVMAIAFASVGLTQWAIRRGDEVLAEVMRRTSMFLPMIPVVGFWLSGSYAVLMQSEQWSWTFFRGTTSYQGLLLVGAIYYGMMSLLWRNGLPRVATVVLANAALWITLTQIPGWDFLSHPQAWLIPPAACVLAVAHLQRDRLDAATSSAVRYACTLVIYLSSTADMLLSEIGTSLWGPIILVLLALAGMAVGVVLRVKPFLYLGTIFAFLGVTSMVWHSTQAIDAVWPWWAFGITTGLLLLTGLAMIEKHRPRLNRLANQLATWDG